MIVVARKFLLRNLKNNILRREINFKKREIIMNSNNKKVLIFWMKVFFLRWKQFLIMSSFRILTNGKFLFCIFFLFSNQFSQLELRWLFGVIVWKWTFDQRWILKFLEQDMKGHFLNLNHEFVIKAKNWEFREPSVLFSYDNFFCDF